MYAEYICVLYILPYMNEIINLVIYMNIIKIAVTITTILVLISLFSTLMERMIQQFLFVQIFLIQLSVYCHKISLNPSCKISYNYRKNSTKL